jgi:hypothetical protein
LFRLTVRSHRDDRVAARIIEQDGELFVLDWGDPALIEDAARRVLHGGFVVTWDGTEQTAVPGSPAMLGHLALHYASHGWLVFADEPGVPRLARVIDHDVTEAMPRLPILSVPPPDPTDPEDFTTEELGPSDPRDPGD